MARKPIIGGNWKMNLHKDAICTLVDGLKETVGGVDAAEVVVFPGFTYLACTAKALEGSGVAVGAQDFWTEANGAYTGEVSLSQLKDVGCKWVLVGHSERRHVIGESDALINAKTIAALEAGLKVILCIGEKQEERESGKTDAINAGQLSLGLAGVPAEQLANIVIAYEPVWAIGTGLTATPQDAQAAHKACRDHLAAMYGPEVADAVRIQYGGSMKPANAAELLAQADIDGGLIGGASLKAADFGGIVDAAAAAAV